MADKKPITPPKQPNKDSNGVTWHRDQDQRDAVVKLNKENAEKGNPEGV